MSSNVTGTCRYNVVIPKYVKHRVEVLKCRGIGRPDVEQTVHIFVEAQNNAEKEEDRHKHFVGTKFRNIMESSVWLAQVFIFLVFVC